MARNRRFVLIAVAAAIAAAIGAWVLAQSLGSPAEELNQPVDTQAPVTEPDYWDEERMEEATPAPMPTVD